MPRSTPGVIGTAGGAARHAGSCRRGGGALSLFPVCPRSVSGAMAGERARGAGGRREKAAAAARGEEAMNRWVLQFYFHQAVEAYRAGRNRDFRQLRDVMQGTPGRREGRRDAPPGQGRPRPRCRSQRPVTAPVTPPR